MKLSHGQSSMAALQETLFPQKAHLCVCVVEEKGLRPRHKHWAEVTHESRTYESHIEKTESRAKEVRTSQVCPCVCMCQTRRWGKKRNRKREQMKEGYRQKENICLSQKTFNSKATFRGYCISASCQISCRLSSSQSVTGAFSSSGGDFVLQFICPLLH